jgi:hypothetical protein
MKIFLTKFSELEGRFDPYFYTIQFLKVKQLDSISHYPIIAISSLSFLVVDGIHKTHQRMIELYHFSFY